MPNSVLTSASAPLPGSIRAVVPMPLGGQVVMSGFPGLETAFDGASVFDPASCDDTIGGLATLGAADLLILIEADELDPEGFALLERTASDHNITVRYAPIVDYQAPDAAFMADWETEAATRRNLFEAGGTFAVACQYGAGRSGSIASLCLIEQGLSPREAINEVRAQFSEAVESTAQEEWLMGHATIAPAAS